MEANLSCVKNMVDGNDSDKEYCHDCSSGHYRFQSNGRHAGTKSS
jgi:hypothetical protein